jgi:hypothetical protein
MATDTELIIVGAGPVTARRVRQLPELSLQTGSGARHSAPLLPSGQELAFKAVAAKGFEKMVWVLRWN